RAGAAVRAAHGPTIRRRLLGAATAPAEAMILGPGDDLAGVAEQRGQTPIALQQVATQADPLAIGGQRRRIGELQHAQRFAAPIAESLLGQRRDARLAGPGTAEQRPRTALHESRRALQQHPAIDLPGRNAGGAPLHQQATGRPRASTLCSARSSTSSRGSPDRRLPSSRKYSMLAKA